MAERELRQRHCAREARKSVALLDDHERGVPRTRRSPRTDAPHPRSFSKSTRRGPMGGAEIPRAGRAVRADRAHLRARQALRRRIARGWIRDSERRSYQPASQLSCVSRASAALRIVTSHLLRAARRLLSPAVRRARRFQIRESLCSAEISPRKTVVPGKRIFIPQRPKESQKKCSGGD